MEMIEPTEEHRWLQKLVGDWITESRMPGPDGKDEVFQGRETVKAVGPYWVQCLGTGEMPGGGEATMVLTLGYNVRTKRFVGTWMGSMMTELWVYDITREASGNVLTMAVEGPNMSGEGTALYRDVIELKGNDLRTLTSHMQGPDGNWTPFMMATYTRTGT